MKSAIQLVVLAGILFGASAHGEPPTFNRDIAPIIFANCSSCHRPNQVAPFSLLSYEDVKKRGRQIAQVTQSHFMPPWLPERAADGVDFIGARQLTEHQIAVIKQWVDGGMIEGDAAELPSPPRFKDGWPLGEPDLVLTVPQPYTLPAETRDTVRTFVFPVSLPHADVVKAVDFDPGNPRIAHHASFLVDTTGTARQLDAADAAPGYPTMGDVGLNLAGSFGTWSPGGGPSRFANGIGRAIPDSCDLTAEVHFNPTGKEETFQPRLALYFERGDIHHRVVSFSLGSFWLDIEAGATNYTVSDSVTLPIGTRLLGLTPHAHYICRRMKVIATLPTGETRKLLVISDWDFNWLQEYRCQEPIDLPAGTKIDMEFTYDNSAANPRNPNNPPQRVRVGSTAADEMGLIFLNPVAANEDDRAKLEKAHQEKLLERMREAQRQRGKH